MVSDGSRHLSMVPPVSRLDQPEKRSQRTPTAASHAWHVPISSSPTLTMLVEKSVCLPCTLAEKSICLPCTLSPFLASLCSSHFPLPTTHKLIVELNQPRLYRVNNPFPWMEQISLQNKANFFERRVGEYAKSGVGVQSGNHSFSLEEDF